MKKREKDQAYSDWLICLIPFCISTAPCLAQTRHSVEICAGERGKGRGREDCSYYNLVQKKTSHCLQIPNYLNRTISEFYYTSYTFSINFTKVD